MHRRSHRFRRLTLISILALAILGIAWQGYRFFEYRQIDVEKINANSVLKTKTFDKRPDEIKTKSGLTAWLIEEKSIPIISISFMFRRSGRAYDPEGKFGLAAVGANMLVKGAGEYDREEFQEQLELNGIQISFAASKENLMGVLTTPKDNAAKAYEMLHAVLTEPLLPKSDLEILKTQALQALKIQLEEPQAYLGLVFNDAVFGKHPYARNPLGEEADISSLTQKDLKDYVQTNLAQDNLLIGIAGDISPQEAQKAIEEIFSGLPVHAQSTDLKAPDMNLKSGSHYVEQDVNQIGSRFAVKGVRRSDKDFYPLYVANYIFGGAGLTSRLSLQAREKENLTYGIYTMLSDDEKAPLLIGQFYTSTQNYNRMIEILGEEWQKFAAYGASADELVAAKNYLLASYNLRFNSISGLANMLVAMQDNNLGLDFLQKRNDYIKAVTLEDVNNAAAKYFAVPPIEVHIGKLDSKE